VHIIASTNSTQKYTKQQQHPRVFIIEQQTYICTKKYLKIKTKHEQEKKKERKQ